MDTITTQELLELSGIKKSKLKRIINKRLNGFPRPIASPGRSFTFDKDAIEKWLDENPTLVTEAINQSVDWIPVNQIDNTAARKFITGSDADIKIVKKHKGRTPQANTETIHYGEYQANKKINVLQSSDFDTTYNTF